MPPNESLSARNEGRYEPYSGKPKSAISSGVRSRVEENKNETFKPKLNKNTDKYLESRQRRLESRQKQAKDQPEIQKEVIKFADKFAISRFEKEYRQTVMKVSQVDQANSKLDLFKESGQHPKISPRDNHNNSRSQYGQEMQQSPNPPTQKDSYRGPRGGATLNYMKVKDLLVGLGLMAEYSVLSPNSPERGHLFELWKILAEDEQQTVDSENLKVLIMVILRVVDPARVIYDDTLPA